MAEWCGFKAIFRRGTLWVVVGPGFLSTAANDTCLRLEVMPTFFDGAVNVDFCPVSATERSAGASTLMAGTVGIINNDSDVAKVLDS